MQRAPLALAILVGGSMACGPAVVEPEVPAEPAVVRLAVTFTTLEVIDDKEGGSGDWRVSLSVDGKKLGEKPVLGEADRGGSVTLDRSAVSEGPEASHQVILTMKVEEWDGGFDNTWEFIGEKSFSFGRDEGFGVGPHEVELETHEGHVKVHYLIVRE